MLNQRIGTGKVIPRTTSREVVSIIKRTHAREVIGKFLAIGAEEVVVDEGTRRLSAGKVVGLVIGVRIGEVIASFFSVEATEEAVVMVVMIGAMVLVRGEFWGLFASGG
jgi:hypothetical protein